MTLQFPQYFQTLQLIYPSSYFHAVLIICIDGSTHNQEVKEPIIPNT